MSTDLLIETQGVSNSLTSSVTGVRRSKDVVFLVVLWLGLLLAVATLATLIIDTFITGRSRLNWEFITGFPSPFPEDAGIQSAIFGSIWVVVPAGVVSLFVAVCTAIYLEEYASKNSRVQAFINLNIQTLAGVPSIVFGILGLAFVARGPLGWGFTVRTASVVLGMMILPIMSVAAREAIRAVPSSLREGAYALGATRWQCVRRQVLPAATPGIATGSILGISRALGESAPLIMLGALAYVSTNPSSFSDYYTVLPLAIFKYATEAQEEFQYAAAAAIIVLLVLMLALNFIAILIRDRSRKSW
jgi:phosphate transport system permease protein